jgi:hypothetical protein
MGVGAIRSLPRRRGYQRCFYREAQISRKGGWMSSRRGAPCGIAALAPSLKKSFKLKHSSLKDMTEPEMMASVADSEDGRA